MHFEEMETHVLKGIARESSSRALSNSMESHNLKVRRRNVTEAAALSGATETAEEPRESSESVGNLVNGCVPRVPPISEPVAPRNAANGTNGALVNNESEDCDSSFEDITLNEDERTKLSQVRRAFEAKESSADELKSLGCSYAGLVCDDKRRKLWPRLLGLEDWDETTESEEELDIIHTRVPEDVYQQILKDVARSGGHLRPNATEKELEKFQDEMTQLICWVLHRHPRLNYYQGYNDIAATILLVMGLQRSLRVLERISLNFLERFMERTMEKVNQELFYIFALLDRVHPTLLQHLENVELFPHFALAEYTTWYAHKYAENRKLLHRLFDFFLGSPPLMPLYLSTVIVAHRDTEIFNTTPDMGHTHKVLCTLPDDLPFEKLLVEAANLYRDFPPDSISNDVREFDQKRRCKEQEWKSKAEAMRKERERLRQLKVAKSRQPIISYPRLRSYRTITVVTILAIGIYAFLKTGTGLN